MTLFAIFAIVMVIGSYLLVLLLAAGCVYGPYLILLGADSFAPQSLVLFLFGIVIAATMVWSLIPRRDKFTASGMLLDRAAQPRLFAELDKIAAALNETLPREVYLIGAPNAFVADRGGVMGFGSRRVMGVGLPLLSLLTVSEFRAVLAHEFAHYYGGDTSLGPWVYKTKTSIVRIFENMRSIGDLAHIWVLGTMYLLVHTILRFYFEGFLRAINFISRKQEFRADELASIVTGRQNVIDGLRVVHRAGTAWPAFWKGEVAPSLSEGSLVSLGEGFARFVSVPAIHGAIAKNLATVLEKEKTGPYDTHPPLRERIAAVQKLADSPAVQDAKPAISLLDDLPTTEMKFVEACVPDTRPGTLKYTSWDDVATHVTIPGWQKFVTEYAGSLQGVTAGNLPDQIARFPEIGSRIRDPKGMLLSPQQRTLRGASLFAAALALALIRSGWELQVQPAIFHIRKGEQEFNPFDALNQLMTGKGSHEVWRARCGELGISELALLPGDDIGAEPSAGRALQPELWQ